MPKDASKQARRGIGFITFASPEAVERVMRQHHSLAGQELVVDKAAPKTKDPLGGGHLGGLYRGASSGHLNGGFHVIVCHWARVCTFMLS